MGDCLEVEVLWGRSRCQPRAGGMGVTVRRGLEEARGETWAPRNTNRVQGVLVMVIAANPLWRAAEEESVHPAGPTVVRSGWSAHSTEDVRRERVADLWELMLSGAFDVGELPFIS